MNKLLWIALGGALGSVLRFLLVGWTHKDFDTTFSASSLETFMLANGGAHFHATLNVLITNASCLIVVWAGFRLAERCVGI